MSHPEILDPAAAAERVKRGDRVLVMYYADWCGYCLRFFPTFEKFAEEGHLPAVAADLTNAPDPVWDAVGVDVVPTVVLYEEGAPIARLEGRPGLGIRDADFHDLVARTASGTRA